jgi:hypothetical protein
LNHGKSDQDPEEVKFYQSTILESPAKFTVCPRITTGVSDPDLDSIRSMDPDPDSESGSRRAKITHKKRKKVRRNIMFCSAGCSLFRAEGFSLNLDVFCGGLGISK